MPKDRVLKEAMEQPDEAVREAHRYEALSGENIEVSRRVQKLRLASDSPAPNKAAPSGQYRRGRTRPSQQLDLYEGPVADSRPRQVRPPRRERTVGVRCPLCGSEIRVAVVALTMECPGCHAIVDGDDLFAHGFHARVRNTRCTSGIRRMVLMTRARCLRSRTWS